MSNYPHIASRVFNRALMLEPRYARAFLGALSERLGIAGVRMPDGSELSAEQLQTYANAYGPRQAGEGRPYETVDGIAVVPVSGTLVHRFGHLNPYSGMTGYDGIAHKIETARADPAVRGIFLDVDSPGGEVSGVFDLAQLIADTGREKPVWALADEMAASAAYALTSAAGRIIVPQTAQVGSVGVVTAHVDYSRALDAEGVRVTLIHAGAHKVDGNPYAPLSDAVRDDIQDDIDAIYGLFAATVARNRGLSEQAVRETEARVFSPRDAIAAGLADEILPARDALAAFDEFLTTGRSTRMTAKTPAAEIVAETPETAAPVVAAIDAPKPAAETESNAPEAASAEQIVTACADAGMPELAAGLLGKGLDSDALAARLESAAGIRDAFAAAGVSHLSSKAIEAGVSAEFCRSLLTDLTAALSGAEVDGHQPPAAGPARAGINAATFYQLRR